MRVRATAAFSSTENGIVAHCQASLERVHAYMNTAATELGERDDEMLCDPRRDKCAQVLNVDCSGRTPRPSSMCTREYRAELQQLYNAAALARADRRRRASAMADRMHQVGSSGVDVDPRAAVLTKIASPRAAADTTQAATSIIAEREQRIQSYMRASRHTLATTKKQRTCRASSAQGLFKDHV